MQPCASFAVLVGGTFAALAATAQTPADVRAAAVREQFRAAYTAVQADGSPEADDVTLRAYVLYPYLRAARLERALGRAEGAWHDADTATAAFLRETESTPVAHALRRAWLTSLAQRNSWAAFIEQYDPSSTTIALECQHFIARIARADTVDLADAIRALWLTGRRLPGECEPAFDWLRAQRELPDALVARRAALLLDNGNAAFARTIAQRLPGDIAAPLLERADFLQDPARMLDALLDDPSRVVPAEVVIEAWTRLARNAPQEALTRFTAVSERVPQLEHTDELARALALGLAWDRRPEALVYFAGVPRAALDDSDLEWWARAALWAGDWSVARAVIGTMSPARQSDAAWRYWAARAAEKLGHDAAARELYAGLAGSDNYYSALAAARLGERVTPTAVPVPLDAKEVETIAAIDAFQRVRELALLDLRELATSEWHFGYARLSEPQRLQAIHLAARWQIYDIAVATATSQGYFNDYALLYPRPYADEIETAVQLTDVEPNLLYGVLRQESLFRADAASSAGALGVAQLTYATARETARRWQLPPPKREELLDSGVSITLGAARFAELLEQFDGQVPVALAAYNAGPAAAARWLPPRAIDSDVWVENIPYNETRAYVRRVLWHKLVFDWLETNRAQSARGWLGKIELAGAAP